MIKFADSEIIQILPEYLRDSPEVQAISYAIRRQIGKYIGYCQSVGVYAMIDTASDAVLDMLAIDLRAQYYEDTLDIETKRAIVKNALGWHAKAGTWRCVQEVIDTVFGHGRVVPWFEDETGDLTPGYFDIEIAGRLTDDEIYEKFSRIIEAAKNVSSHLRRIGLIGDLTTELKVVSADTECQQASMTDDLVIDDPERQLYVGGYMTIVDSAEIEDEISETLENIEESFTEALCLGSGLTQGNEMTIGGE